MPQTRKMAPATTRPTDGPFAHAAPVAIPRQREIADLAFKFWLARGFQGGSPEEDLFRAEREISAGTGVAKRQAARLFLVPKPGS